MKIGKNTKTVLKVILQIAIIIICFYAAGIGAFIGAFEGKKFIIWLSVIFFFFTALLSIFIIFWKSRRKIFSIAYACFFGAALLATASYAGWNIYENSIPKVNENFDYAKYVPFSSKKIAKLGQESLFKINNNFPNLDGAYALCPMYFSFVEAAYPAPKTPNSAYLYDNDCEDKKGAYAYCKNFIPGLWNSMAKCSTSPEVFERLASGVTDVAFGVAPSPQQVKDIKARNKTYELTPIGKEAFVFFVNDKNPVDNLTLEQVRLIYEGKIINWKELGGSDKKIRAFQRPTGSGSQNALEKLMQGRMVMKAPKEDVPAGMGGIIKRVANYKNYGGALGFSFRYYLTEMKNVKGIKMLKINGVYPSEETIKDGSYPLSSEFYAITAGTKNPNAKPFIEWVLSPQGQILVQKSGYVPVK